MKKFLVFPLILLTFSSFAQVKISAESLYELHKINQKLENNQLKENIKENLTFQIINGKRFVSALIKSEPNFIPEDLPDSFILSSSVGNIHSIKINVEHLDQIYEIQNVANFELARKISPNLEKAVIDLRVDSVWSNLIASGLPVTGKNVIIGITDWGFDYTHPMFYDTALQHTRIIAVWDQFKNGGTPPSGFSYGSEIEGETNLLTAQSDTACVYYDYATHGSHVAGIAGGSGAGAGLKGMAFESEFLFSQFYLDEASALDAVNWMHQKAKSLGKRLVINMSWGLYHIGTLDGKGLLSQALDQLALDGLILVTSAGNNGDVAFHIEKEFNTDTIYTKVNFDSYNGNPNMWGQDLSMWGEPSENFSARIEIYDGNVLETTSNWFVTNSGLSYSDTVLLAGTDSIYIKVLKEESHPLNQKPFLRLSVKNKNVIKRVILRATANSGKVHFFNVTNLTNGAGNWGMPFAAFGTGATLGDQYFSIGEPACTQSAITVGAHASQNTFSNGITINGSIAAFSSSGPNLDGSIKPDITGPGVNVESSISSFTTRSYNKSRSVSFKGRNYDFARFSGTSMSSPAVAGVVALMLNANPNLNADEVKQILKSTAREDDKTGVLPAKGSVLWGFGKVNAYRAVQEALALSSVNYFKGEQEISFFPNPTSDVVYIMGAQPNCKIQIFDLSGKLIQANSNTHIVDLSNLKSGIYLLKYECEGKLVHQKLIKY